MNNTVNYIKQRLSLRQPLGEALEVVEKITDVIALEKAPEHNKAEFLKEQLSRVQSIIPQCKDFEREFPSFSFSIATGVGKTRLMGACISYLYLKKGIRHFFILAPNLPIYEKLVRDFGDPSYEKYVFRGIAEFVTHQPIIVNGENYEQHNGSFSFDSDGIQINIFNISKFNTDNKESRKGGQKIAPRMKRLCEYLGQSYYDYLAGLKDLVILMDEAHRYHADASKKAIDELSPVMGLEMTATPTDEKGNSFRNIVYEYNLAQALKDGLYVKNPTVASRKNFQKAGLTAEELDIIKLEDAVSIHEQTKAHLELYSKQNNKPVVKPFILVACRDKNHAQETKERLESDDFFHGRYKGKVLKIDSSTKKDDEVEALFESLDKPDNVIEIVIHVMMLKEGWDVSNLYTIVPLRASDALILVEQTIGRGLRLPYGGRRTGESEVDKLTVIAHENFNAVINAAKDPKSVLNRVSFIEYDEDKIKEKYTVVTAVTKQEESYQQQQEQAHTEEEKKEAKASIDAKKAVWEILPKFNTQVATQDDLAKEQNIEMVRKAAIEYIEDKAKQSDDIFAEQEAQQAKAQVEKVVRMVIKDYVENIIPIPRMTIQQTDTHVVYNWFDLDTATGFDLPSLKEEIIRVGLVDNEVETLQALSSGAFGNPVDQIVSELINYEEIDYDECSDLLFRLAEQAANAIKSGMNENDDLTRVVHQFKKLIAARILDQIKSHMILKSEGFVKPNILPFVEILPQHFTDVAGYGRKDFREIVNPPATVKKYIFTGFMRSYYVENKFDSSTEQDFAYVLENDPKVLKWLRPVTNQFNIYWGNGAHKYEPDFIVETSETIYMVETKSSSNMNDADVLSKKASAEEYCKYATEYNKEHGGKNWQYVIVPHDAVKRTSSFDFLMAYGNKI
jgi:type III restriction enzyme